jgi:DNA-binding NarL/FixJ family response regulator
VAITVAVISQSIDQRQYVARAVGEMPDLFVTHHADDLKTLRDLPALPQVVIIGVPHLTGPQGSDRLWKALAWIRKTAPETRLAVWFDEADAGATADLRANGVAGIVQWSDARGDFWPKLVRTLFAGSQFWSRPFDTLDQRSTKTTSAQPEPPGTIA